MQFPDSGSGECRDQHARATERQIRYHLGRNVRRIGSANASPTSGIEIRAVEADTNKGNQFQAAGNGGYIVRDRLRSDYDDIVIDDQVPQFVLPEFPANSINQVVDTDLV